MEGSKLGNGVYRGGEEIFRELFQQYGDTVYGMLLAKCKDQQLARNLLKDIFREVYQEIVEAGSVDITAVWLKSVTEAHLKQARPELSGAAAQIAAQGKPQQAVGQQRQQVPVAVAAPYAGQAAQPQQAAQPRPVAQPQAGRQFQQAAQQPRPAAQPQAGQQFQQVQQPRSVAQPQQGQQFQQAQQPRPMQQPQQAGQQKPMQQPKAAVQPAKGQPQFLKPKLIQPLGKGNPAPAAAGAAGPILGLIGAQGNFEPYIPSGQQAKEKKKNVGRIVLICGLSVLILMTLWLLLGLMMDMGILPEVNLGYEWFNKNVFSLF